MNKFRLPTSAQPKPPAGALESVNKLTKKGRAPKPANKSGVQIPLTFKGPNR